VKHLLWIVAFFALLIAGCKQNPTSPAAPTNPSVSHAVYILSQGNYGSDEAALSVYDESSGVVYNNLFEAANNGEHLGDVGQDIKLSGGNMYLTMDASQGLFELRQTDHKLLRKADPSHIATPYDLLVDSIDNRLFVGDLYANSVVAFSLDSLKYLQTIQVTDNPQGMVLADGKVYVCDSIVTVFTASTGHVLRTLTGGTMPVNAALSAAGEVLICYAGVDSSDPGELLGFDPFADTLTRSIVFPGALAGSIAVDNLDYAYVVGVTPDSYAGGPIHKINLANNEVQLNLIAGTYYTVAFNPYTGELVITNVENFEGNGTVSIASATGTLKKTFTAGIIPGAIAFSW
jgi:DNA-binding beta-propeller fold protein YncE